MSDASLVFSAPASVRSPVATLRERQPALTAVGFAFLLLAAVTATLPMFDGRMLDGAPVWAKPAKFFLSTGVFLLTSAWFFGYVRPDRRSCRALRVSVVVAIAAAVFEVAYITVQAALGERSHFNQDDALHFALYGLMGAAALAMLLTKIPLAVEIARRPAAETRPEIRRAIVIGVWLTVVLGAASGVYMSQQYTQGHNVGAVGGAAPLFGWNRAGGDLRVAHFFGMHAEQILPIVAALGACTVSRRRTDRLVTAAAVAIAGLAALAFVQALAGRPFPVG